MASSRRERKRARRAEGTVDGIKIDKLEAYIETRIVCDRCGLEQPYVYEGTCIGPLGLDCAGESGISLRDFRDGGAPKPLRM